MRHSKIKGMGKRKKNIRKRNNTMHFCTLGILMPVCMTKDVTDDTDANQYIGAKEAQRIMAHRTWIREDVTCKRCKKTPQFLIVGFERRFGTLKHGERHE